MDIRESTVAYEKWLSQQTKVVPDDLNRKHVFMREAVFPFFRATFYRWLQLWPEICKKIRHAPTVLAVGDLHVENFGTWRDTEGRLIWGVNDFDEAAHLPYTQDLVRLATSALLATQEDHLDIKPRVTCEAILEGYADALAHGGRPFVLAELHTWMRAIAQQELRDPQLFWERMSSWPVAADKKVPAEVRNELEGQMPKPTPKYKVVLREAGLGSRGHQRFVALFDWHGGAMAREAKALVPSAATWLDQRHSGKIFYREILDRAVRVSDPTFHVAGSWLIRRLAPDCTKIAIADLPNKRNEERMLYSMGWETANIHLGTEKQTKAIVRDLKKRKSGWLSQASKDMAKVVRTDWKDWSR